MSFALDDLLISSESAEGFVSASENGLTVVLDVHITEELLLEGIKRELVSKIQSMRKEAGFDVTDRINISYCASGNSKVVLTKFAEEIKGDILAETIVEIELPESGFVKEIDVNGDKVILSVEKLS